MVPFDSGSTFAFRDPPVLFESPGMWSGSAETNGPYAVAPDDRRFLIVRIGSADGAGAPTTNVVLVESFFEELKRVAP